LTFVDPKINHAIPAAEGSIDIDQRRVGSFEEMFCVVRRWGTTVLTFLG